MQRNRLVVAVLLSVALHALGIMALVQGGLESKRRVEAARPEERVIRLQVTPMPPMAPAEVPSPDRPEPAVAQAPTPKPAPAPGTALQAARETVAQPPPTARPQALMDAPPAPTAQE